MLGTMYFSCAPFYSFAIKKNLNDSEQGTVPHESREHHDSSSALRLSLQIFKLLTIQFLVCPSSLSCICLTGARSSLFSSPLFQTQSFLKVSMTPYTNVFVPSRLANWPRQGYLQTLSVLIMTVSRLSSILVNRLVYNLRELAVKQLPTTVETAGRFQAALPVFRQPLSMIYVQNPSFVMTATREMVASFPEGETPRQQLRTMDVIGYETERRSHVRLSVGRQHPATSASVEAYPL